MKVLLIDNFDSFTLNIAQYLYEVTGVLPIVLPNTVPVADLPLDEVQAVVISPGPGRPSRPSDFGVCREVIAGSRLPILGVCLGHQGIAEHFGARTVRAPQPAHGIVDTITHSGTGIFAGLPQNLPVVRYHSLVSVDLPEELTITARTRDDLVMAFAHRERPIWGVQFHPESIATRGGHTILTNFVQLARKHHTSTAVAEVGWGRATEATPTPTPRPGPAARAFRRVGGATSLRLHAAPLNRPAPPEELFRSRYAHQAHAFWLDSENSDRPGSRYSLMGAATGAGSVVLRYDLPSHRLTLIGQEHTEHVGGDVFDLLQEILSAVDVQAPPDWPLPFTGGLVGYLGYELKALTVGTPRHRAPDPDAWFVHATEFVLYDHMLGRAYQCRLRPDRDGSAPSPPAPSPAVPGLAEPGLAEPGLAEPGPALETEPDAPNSPPGAASPRPHSSAGPPALGFAPGPVDERGLCLRDGHDEYLAKIVRAQELITDGETYEVCLTTSAHVAGVTDGLSAYQVMRRISPVPYGAYLRCGDTQVLCSSPETFLRVGEDRVVESRPIKGTRPRGTTTAEDEALRHDLLTSAKDRAENLMIVDLVRHDLNAVCEPGSVHAPEVFTVESYSSVHQLVSTIRGRLRSDMSALDAVRACYPGGSMTGAPKKRTMEIIDTLEGAARGIYSGSIGWLSFSGALDLSIVIRTAVLRDSTASFGVGGAITATSDPEGEFQEILVKASVPHFALTRAQEGAGAPERIR